MLVVADGGDLGAIDGDVGVPGDVSHWWAVTIGIHRVSGGPGSAGLVQWPRGGGRPRGVLVGQGPADVVDGQVNVVGDLVDRCTGLVVFTEHVGADATDRVFAEADVRGHSNG